MNPKVDFFFNKATQWKAEYEKLRSIVLDCDLDEVLKWGCPCYALESGNVVLIHGFKEYCALLFMKGAIMRDPEGILIQQTENVQAARQLRFTNLEEIEKMADLIKSYILNAIELEKAGLKVEMKKSTDLVYPEEFQEKLDADSNLKAAFEALTPGRQRQYNLHFSSAKQSKTRAERVEKAIPMILDGKGLND